MKIVLITGGFDIIHSGHIHYIRGARKLAGKTGKLFVGAIIEIQPDLNV